MPENSNSNSDLIVIGAGPGGYVAAIRAAQLGMKVACVERQYLGGTCLNVGCIPSKALLDSSEKLYAAKHQFSRHGIGVGEISLDLAKMMSRKEQVVKALTGGVGLLFKKNKVEHIVGQAEIVGSDSVEVNGRRYSAKRILIATGSAPIELPSLKFDGKNILSSTEVLSIPQVPKRMIVVGAGYIGLEMASVWSRLGSDVLVLEFLERCLPPSDAEMAGALQKLLEKQGLKFRFKTTAESAKVEGGKVKVTWKSGDQTGVEEVDKVLVSVGRRPVTDSLGLDRVGVKLDKKGFIPVDSRFQTNIPGIFAIGDVIGGIMLAHKAEEEGIAAVELMAGNAGHVNYAACPAVVYTHPELAQVGLTEEEARQRNGQINIGKFPFIANGRARGMDETDGFVKVIADAKTDRLLGVHILAAHASDIIAEAVVAIEMGASSEDVARSFHAHPTLPEALKEAALAVEKRAIHI
ncbi:MAG TPA: dihydrolipoyl dehydrogenase [Tepidisphaeraceae bacterium]|jgi:dihydrolipoamide dehydrogenase